MGSKILGCTAELLAIAFSMFPIGILLTTTGLGVKLYGGQSQETYILPLFFGAACAASFYRITCVTYANPYYGAIAQTILPPLLSFAAIAIAVITVGVMENLIFAALGKENIPVETVGITILIIGNFLLAFYLPGEFAFTFLVNWLPAAMSCLIGMSLATY